MKEYIEREAVIQDIIKAQESLESNIDKEWIKNKPCFKGLAWANKIILETPAADVTPIVHGKWIPKEIEYPMFGCLITIAYICSSCGTTHEHQTNYCPFCGARMDGGNKQ